MQIRFGLGALTLYRKQIYVRSTWLKILLKTMQWKVGQETCTLGSGKPLILLMPHPYLLLGSGQSVDNTSKQPDNLGITQFTLS